MRGINTDLMPSMPNAKVEVAALGEKWAFFGLAKKKLQKSLQLLTDQDVLFIIRLRVRLFTILSTPSINKLVVTLHG